MTSKKRKIAQVQAAAPDLLAALRGLLTAYESLMPGIAYISVPDYAIINDAPLAARRAIKKAEGQ